MADDDLEARDIETTILTGKVIRRFTHDPRGPDMKSWGQRWMVGMRMLSVVFFHLGSC
jgi:hypothetical protein